MTATATSLDQKLARMADILRELGTVLVAYSGGIDSTLLLKVAHDTLGERAVGVISASESIPSEEVRDALAVAESLGIPVLTTYTSPNSPTRTTPRTRRIAATSARPRSSTNWRRSPNGRGLRTSVMATNLDDLGDHRPGAVAARERGVRAPLLEAGLDKADIRAAAQQLGGAELDKPAMACLSSRVPYGTAIDAGVLEQIWRGESFLRGLGFRQLRVRHHGDIARIEVPLDDLPRAVAPETREAIQSHFKSIGYLYVTLDLAGFKSGSMNAKLPIPIVVRHGG